MPVYMIRAGDDGLVKIGFSDSVHTRLAKMRTDAPQVLKLLRILDGGRELEAALHARFKPLRARGEWFTFTEEMMGDLGAASLSVLRPRPVAANGKAVWTPDRRAQAAVSQLRLYADPEKSAARKTKMRATMLGKSRFTSMRDVARRAGGWHQLSAKLGLPLPEVMAWEVIPIRYLEAVAAAADVPIMKLANVCQMRAAA